MRMMSVFVMSATSPGTVDAAVPQDHEGVADIEDLVEKVGDVDDRLAFVAQTADDAEEDFLFLQAERRGGFVEDHDVGAHGKGTGDLDDLPLADRKVFHGRGRADVRPKHVEVALRLAVGGRLADEERQDGTHEQMRDENVLGDGLRGEVQQFLVNEGDAVALGIFRRMEPDLAAVEEDVAGIGVVDAAEDVHQGRLAGAVDADEADNLAGANLERNVVERLDARELLGDSRHAETGRSGAHRGALERRTSSPMMTTSTTPLMTIAMKGDTPTRLKELPRTVMKRRPSMVPRTLPDPPVRLAPPMTVVAMTSIRRSSRTMAVVAVPTMAVSTIAVMPAINPEKT